MSVPKERIWQELRSDCLSAIPPECRTIIPNPVPLSEWQTRGYYTVTGITRTQFQLAVSTADLGSALLTEAECCLDGAAEHQASLRNQILSDDWHSPAWTAVAVYYWSFYLALATTRLLGRTAWFLLSDHVKRLRAMGPPAAVAPGAGSYYLTVGQELSATDRELILEKTDARIHDEIWRVFFNIVDDKLNKVGLGKGTPEERLFVAINRTATQLGKTWPSQLRNAVNYRAGFAYTAVRRIDVLKPITRLRRPASYDWEQLLDKFESSVVAVRRPELILSQPQVVLDLLTEMTFFLYSIVLDLHAEVVDRHKLDARWRNSRKRFIHGNGLISTEGTWPV